MEKNPFVKEYAKDYDLIYKDKQYDSEVAFLNKIFVRNKVKKVLDIACGTGNHLYRLAELGYEVMGMDASKAMVNVAKKKGLACGVQKMQQFKVSPRFDAIICMFASIDYLPTEADLIKTFLRVHNTLDHKGLFIFDFWNKVCVEKNHKPIAIKGERISKNKLIGDDTLEVTMFYKETKQKHLMRYYTPDAIQRFLKDSGFRRIRMFPFLQSNQPITKDTWSIQVVANKT